MGDLSIVIEDESNMINLWDFGRNPAGFLADDTGSVVRGDLLWEPHEGRQLVTAPDRFPSLWQLRGDILRASTSVSFRRNTGLALGVEADYSFRKSDFATTKTELESPGITLVLSKGLGSLTCVGADIEYAEVGSKTNHKYTESQTHFTTKCFKTQLGVGRELASEVTVATLVGYSNLESEPYSRWSDVDDYWLALQTVVEIRRRLKLGMETGFNLRRLEFHLNHAGHESYRFNSLKLRVIYDLTRKLRLGMVYFDNEVFTDFFHPLSSDAFVMAHWGIGCSYEFDRKIIAGVEYHFRDSSRPEPQGPDFGIRQESVNLGVEVKALEVWPVRGGYVRTWGNVNPTGGWGSRYSNWENRLTLGMGYSPKGSDLIFEFSYQYAFKDFPTWHRDYKRQAKRYVLALSFKGSF